MFFQRRYRDCLQTHERMFNIINDPRNAKENQKKMSSHTCQGGYHQTSTNNKCSKNVEKGNSSTLLLRMQIGAATMKSSIEFPPKTKTKKKPQKNYDMIKQFHFLLYTEENKNKNLKKTHAQQRSQQHYIQQPIYGNKLRVHQTTNR